MIVHNMEMPTGCDECPFENFGDCYGGKIKRIMDVDEEIAKGVRHKDCPLKEHETTDRIMLRDAIEGPAVWSVVAALDPERPIVVRMTYADLYAIAKMIQDKSDQETLKQIRNILRNVLLVNNGVNNSPRPVKNTKKQECYDALYEIQELLEMRKMDRRLEL